MGQNSNPRVAKFDGNQTITWSNGSPFNGFALIGIVLPTSGGTPWAYVSPGDNYPGAAVPTFQYASINDGKLNTQAGVFYNEDLSPPNSKYAVWYYDLTGRPIGNVAGQFYATAPTVTLPTTTLTAPAEGSNPVPD